MFIRSCYALRLGWLVFAFAVVPFGIASDASEAAGEPGREEFSQHVPKTAEGRDGAEAGHAPGGHATLDLSHADGGPDQENPAQWKADLAIYTFVVFVLLLAVLWKFAWGPIISGLEKREKAIGDRIDQAQQSADQARAQLREYQAKLAGAADEVRGLLEQARKDADAQKQTIVAEAQEAARAERDRALEEIEVAKNQALGELAEQSVDTAIELAGRIVRRQLTAEDHARLVQESLQNLPSEN